MWRALTAVLLASSGVAACVHLWPQEPLQTLMSVPADLPDDGDGGFWDVTFTAARVGPEAGRHTVIEFYSPDSEGCRLLRTNLAWFVRLRPDVAVRRLRLDPSLAERFHVETVPHVIIYDAAGKVVAQDDGQNKAGLQLLCTWMKAELDRAYQTSVVAR